jgi:hypothetical protein
MAQKIMTNDEEVTGPKNCLSMSLPLKFDTTNLRGTLLENEKSKKSTHPGLPTLMSI